jgi:hypothetical protein
MPYYHPSEDGDEIIHMTRDESRAAAAKAFAFMKRKGMLTPLRKDGRMRRSPPLVPHQNGWRYYWSEG